MYTVFCVNFLIRYWNWRKPVNNIYSVKLIEKFFYFLVWIIIYLNLFVFLINSLFVQVMFFTIFWKFDHIVDFILNNLILTILFLFPFTVVLLFLRKRAQIQFFEN